MGMETTVLLIVVLVLGAMALIVAEICTPTFGVLALSALACLAWSCYLAFTVDATFGIVMIVAVLIGMPVFIYWSVHFLPKTALGRHLALRKVEAPPGQGTPESDLLQPFVGRSAEAETTLRPSGTIRIDGRRVVAQAEAGMIEKGQQVTVLKACGTYVLVRKIEPPPPQAPPPQGEGSENDPVSHAE